MDGLPESVGELSIKSALAQVNVDMNGKLPPVASAEMVLFGKEVSQCWLRF